MQGISRRTTKLHPATSPQLTKAGTSWTSNGVRHNPPSTYSSWYWGNWEPRSPPGSLLNMNGSTYTTVINFYCSCILITFITMPYHKYTTRRFPINFKQFGNASIFCITLTCITYVLTYGKVLDWYDDPTIQWATVCAIIAGGIFLYIESTQRNPYYQLDVFKLRTIRMGFLFYFLLMVLNSSAMFVNVFTGIGMKLDNFQNATLSNWSMLGYLIGGIATIWLSVKGVHFKYLFAAGFLLLGLSAMFMYFEVQGAGLYERMKYPVIIRSTGMMFLYSLIQPTPPNACLTNIFLLGYVPCLPYAWYWLPASEPHSIRMYCKNANSTTSPAMHRM